MNKFYILIVLVVAFAYADDEPFSIGLGVLSPSYTQTVGKENVKVNFEQKDNGFAYSVGDPASGTNTYLNFGSAAGSHAINPAGYADTDPSILAGASPSGYAGASGASGYAGASGASGYAGLSSAGPSPSGYAGLSPSGYAGSNLGGYSGPSPSGYAGPASSGYVGPQSSATYSGFAGYQQPSVGGFGGSGLDASGYGASGYGASGFGSAANSFGGSSGLSGLYSGQAAAAPGGYFGGESARKPDEPAQILPAGFSYHGTDGQSFLNQGDGSPNFMVSEGNQETSRGPAEKSFQDTFKERGSSGSGKVLVNGLVGYGPGGQRGSGQRGSLPVGGYAGPQFAGLVREHGGHE